LALGFHELAPSCPLLGYNLLLLLSDESEHDDSDHC